MISDKSLNWPKLPYLGLRRFEASDRLLYCGRDQDIALCRYRLASPAVRVLVLQGVSGSGKSSFLRAGLIPALEDIQKNDPTESPIPISCVVHAGVDVISRISQEVYQFIVSGVGRECWQQQAEDLTNKYPSGDKFGAEAYKDVRILIKLLVELSSSPRYTFLIAVDQVEELWSAPVTENLKKTRDQFIQLVNEFVLERLNGKLVLTLRTEWYGIFASKLPDSTMPSYVLDGVNRLCHYFLADPSREEMISLVKRPADNAPMYHFSFEDNLPEKIVEDIQKVIESEGLGICALPLLQVILKRLYDEGNERCRMGKFVISFQDYQELIALHGRHLKSIDLLDGYLKFGLEKAIAKLSRDIDSSISRTEVHKRIEVARWRVAIEILSQPGGSKRKSFAELDKAARDAKCELDTKSVLHSLSTLDIGILTEHDNPVTYTFRHDLLSRVFDLRSKNSSTELWRQTFNDKRWRISESRYYSCEDLYGGDPPQTHKIQLAELRFWDHKVLAYASEQGFFKRLGIDTQLVLCNENITATDLVKRLAVEPQCHYVYSYPRRLMSAQERESSTDVVVLNQFNGYAVICNGAAMLTCLKNDVSLDKFNSTIDAMLKIFDSCARFVAEDQGAAEFFKQALKLSKGEMGKQSFDAIDRLSKAIEIERDGPAAVLEGILQASQPFVGIVTAPTWAIARMMGEDIKTVFDHRNLFMLLSKARTTDAETIRQLQHNLSVHNVVNIQIPRERIGSEFDPLLMRLASVGLFLVNCIWALDDEVGKWVRARWIEKHPRNSILEYSRRVTQEVFLDTFRRSYRYAPSSDHFNYYFDSESGPISNLLDDSDVNDSDDYMMALQIHNKLLQANVDYQRHAIALASLSKRRGGGTAPCVNELVERAKKHANICNYYDAERLLAEALKLVNGASQKNA